MTERPRETLGSPATRRVLARLHERPVNFAVDPAPSESDGWKVDDHSQPLPPEAPGPPEPAGSWEIARRLIRDYEFADPRIVRAVYYPDAPLEGRDMLLVGRFFGLRFRLGVRIGGVVDERRTVGGRPVQVWGWDYRTLQGHLEAGRMDYEVWKWLDTGDVEFRIRRVVRTARNPNPVVRAGWALFGRWMQQRFVRRACERMAAFVRYELAGGQGSCPPRAVDVIGATPLKAGRVFGFGFEPWFRVAAAPFGIRPGTAHVTVVDGRLVARFGPWRVDTPVANVDGWDVTGPFAWWKTIGPAHLSIADRGLTFATNPRRALCIRFREPVGGMDPRHRLRHPGLTVTVADVPGLAAALAASREEDVDR